MVYIIIDSRKEKKDNRFSIYTRKTLHTHNNITLTTTFRELNCFPLPRKRYLIVNK